MVIFCIRSESFYGLILWMTKVRINISEIFFLNQVLEKIYEIFLININLAKFCLIIYDDCKKLKIIYLFYFII